jgi:hypothetical protein
MLLQQVVTGLTGTQRQGLPKSISAVAGALLLLMKQRATQGYTMHIPEKQQLRRRSSEL